MVNGLGELVGAVFCVKSFDGFSDRLTAVALLGAGPVDADNLLLFGGVDDLEEEGEGFPK